MNENFVRYVEQLVKNYHMNNDILFVQPPQFSIKGFDINIARRNGYYAFPPLGLQYLVKALSGRGLKFSILDLNFELLKKIRQDQSCDPAQWIKILDDFLDNNNPSVVGATCINVSQLQENEPHPFYQLLGHLMKKDKYIVLSGGVLATYRYKRLLNKNLAHFIFGGESESSVRYLFDVLNNNNQQNQKPGIYFKFNEKIEQTEGEADVTELKGNLIESYKLFPIEEYNSVGSLNPYTRMVGKPYSVIQFLRGCRGRCTFCNVHVYMGHALRHFPVEDVLSEMIYLSKERGIKHFELLDDDPLADKQGFKEILKGVISNELNITWSSNNGLIAAFIDEELLTLMMDSGCIGFKIGVESGNAEVLRNVKKPGTIPSFRKVSAMFKKFPEMFFGANYIIGLPCEETFGQMLDTYNFSIEMDLDWSSYFMYQPLQMNTKNEKTSNFIPSRGKEKGKLIGEEGVLSGLDIFSLDKSLVPSVEQLEQIWFTFNLLVNFVHNKHLKIDGNPKKFVSWLEAVQASYPSNPYMSLFNCLGNILINNLDSAQKHYLNAKKIIQSDQYWKHRFDEFKLTQIVDLHPKNPKEVYDALDSLKGDIQSYLAYKLIEIN